VAAAAGSVGFCNRAMRWPMTQQSLLTRAVLSSGYVLSACGCLTSSFRVPWVVICNEPHC
jgi:hypothetical protein